MITEPGNDDVCPVEQLEQDLRLGALALAKGAGPEHAAEYLQALAAEIAAMRKRAA